ncbi:pyrophosphate--fructose 6-phosphate 1-phosphotransferase subunit beta-like [Humulus lupulus]|uniref:pyrophosphate--fructose 6-phosphate 1-phosphotransferase subunit beta-like n=1 Tax=Humulus lupulus TaxID=3486 RepID=UPI002B40B02B|nr:pyrophosphate--fructose 6-phosphate 1-phosphotransferase subunit beta-like [Humulus lupulus]
MKGKYVELTPEYIYPYRNQGGFDMICSGRDKIETPEQFQQAADTAAKLDLDGLLVIGGDDSNTNACLLAENFRGKNLKTQVIGCPKTIDGDLKCKEVPISFGFDTACKIYAEMIGNVMIDARSTGKYYHFVRLMGRAASHITLECALQTHPKITIVGEELHIDVLNQYRYVKGKVLDVIGLQDASRIVGNKRIRFSKLWAKKNAVGKEQVAQLVDDIYRKYIFLFLRKMHVSAAPDLASKGQGVSDNSNVKVKGEIDDHSFQSETKVRCLCGISSEKESMIKITRDTSGVPKVLTRLDAPSSPLADTMT